MAKIPVANAVKKVWIALVVLVVILVAGFCVTRLRAVFGDHDNRGITSGSADDIKPFNPKQDRKSTRLNSSHSEISRMPSSA